MSEGASKLSGPIPPDPTLFPEYYKRPTSARGRLEGNSVKLDLLSGPLAPDPRLYPSCYSARPLQAAPRIRPNAKEILERGQKGTVGVLLQLDEDLVQNNPPLKKKQPKDHEKENVRRMREIQKKCREREQELELGKPQPIKALWKSQKYENVPSKVMAQLQEVTPPKISDQPVYLKAHSRSGYGMPPRRSVSPSPRQTAPADDSDSLKLQVKGVNIDFVSHNARNAKRSSIRRSRSMQMLSEVLEKKQCDLQEYHNKQKGHMPQYLLERRDQWRREAEERRKNALDPSMPPGHTLMPESERLETLSTLKQTQQQLLKELLTLPVRADNLSMQNRRTQLDKKLSEIEEAIKIFSRPKVFIQNDS
ncbi:enkurin domain-containing protein 1 [Protopterus annectens]|uniref:enkurin domain-containing protein 1 n=1 Tax=Protopterus annectens TaxID=7888 RepID=UPI001CFBF88D|nr:enkurin domain-containing protein 1 [Protopterus annectens]XP_043938910.1 enkurin domain-containing protein 1 [Protopterus annectens]